MYHALAKEFLFKVLCGHLQNKSINCLFGDLEAELLASSNVSMNSFFFQATNRFYLGRFICLKNMSEALCSPIDDTMIYEQNEFNFKNDTI